MSRSSLAKDENNGSASDDGFFFCLPIRPSVVVCSVCSVSATADIDSFKLCTNWRRIHSLSLPLLAYLHLFPLLIYSLLLVFIYVSIFIFLFPSTLQNKRYISWLYAIWLFQCDQHRSYRSDYSLRCALSNNSLDHRFLLISDQCCLLFLSNVSMTPIFLC